jgi:hypothetical protein
MRPAEEPACIILIISKLGYDGNPIGYPYQIEKYEDFALPLMNYMTSCQFQNTN